MVHGDIDNAQDYPSPTDMQSWLMQEIRDSEKAHELRISEATGFINAYASGNISPEEAALHLRRYQDRWGEPLFGATAGEHMCNEEIIAAVDNARKKQANRSSGHRQVVKRLR
jgi:hypothetical protein